MNYTEIFTDPNGIAGYMMQTFSSMQPYFWVMFFGGIIGYVYLAMKSLTATVVMILLTFGIWAGTSFSLTYFGASEVSLFVQLLYTITLVGLVTLVATFIMKRSR
jgi:hypothetical protein